MSMKSFRALAVALVGMAAFSASASAEDIRVMLDHSFPVRLAQPAAGVAVGNPSIAGVSMQNGQFFFVTGRAYGSTSLTVVDANNHILYTGRVVVVPSENNVVHVTRGTETARLECTPLCHSAPDIGDANFDEINQQSTTRASTANSAGH